MKNRRITKREFLTETILEEVECEDTRGKESNSSDGYHKAEDHIVRFAGLLMLILVVLELVINKLRAVVEALW